ncbi:O-antigen ligase family protein [Brevibacillus parabrevis]|uniref:O-antigen ligase family protein n=1 Tax=Brevibacillus parabrevis TaxID=54914 RepID=UPI0028D1C598|nr:O-antigen ligase family protein [Brevibacillus parabrevis]
MAKAKLSLDKVLLFLYVLLKPFYFFPSGNPQIADFVMMLLIAYTFLFQLKWLERKYRFFIVITLLFLYDILLVNGIWAIALGGVMEVFESTKWYLYNGAVMLTIIVLGQRDPRGYAKWLFWAVACSLAVQTLALLFGLAPGEHDFRQALFFNNPNQLGYYGLLCLGICLFCARFFPVKSLYLFLVIGCSLSVIAASLSKAAILSAVLMYLVFLFVSSKERTGLFWQNVLCVLALFFLLFCVSLYTNENVLHDATIYTQVKERMETLGEDSDDNLASRGYDRIANHPQYMFFGAGEGQYERFESTITLELHSTIANLFFSYGIVGTLLFLLLLYAGVRGHRLYSWYPLFFQIVYGLTHNGIRETFFWILLALYCVTAGLSLGSIKNGGDLHGKNLANLRN